MTGEESGPAAAFLAPGAVSSSTSLKPMGRMGSAGGGGMDRVFSGSGGGGESRRSSVQEAMPHSARSRPPGRSSVLSPPLGVSDRTKMASESEGNEEPWNHNSPKLDAGRYEFLGPKRISPISDFLESQRFQGLMGICVAANVAELVLETDYPDRPYWVWLDHLFVVCYTLEFTLRLHFLRSSLFAKYNRRWAFFNMSLVVIGLSESLWTIFGTPGFLSQLFRLLRVGRLLRIVRIIPSLSIFFNALFGMGSSVMVIFSMIFLLILVSAIVCTQLFGHTELAGAEDSATEGEAIRRLFHDVRTSLFSLFRVTTQDNWYSVAGPVVSTMPFMRFFFVAFIVFVAWTMISVLTAVASNSMIEATSDRKEAERRMMAAKQKAFIEFLRHSFEEGDTDGNGELDQEEFETLVSQPRVINQMKALGVNLSVEELSKTWQMLDVHNAGTLTIDAFVDGLSYLQDSLSVAHFFNLDQSVKRSGIKFRKALDRLEAEAEAVRQQHAEILEHLQVQAVWKQEKTALLREWKNWAVKRDSISLSHSKRALVLLEEAARRPAAQLQHQQSDQASDALGDGASPSSMGSAVSVNSAAGAGTGGYLQPPSMSRDRQSNSSRSRSPGSHQSRR